MNQIEALLNWSSDLHWGPFEFLRPAKSAAINRRLFGIICAVSVVFTFVGVILCFLAFWAYGFHADHHRLPDWLAVRAVIKWLAPYAIWIGGASVFVLPLFWWPCVAAWNRRAARLCSPLPLCQETNASETIWPPPPQRS